MGLTVASALLSIAACWLVAMVLGPKVVNRLGRIGPRRLDPRTALAGRAPKVSVIVAARDEEAAISDRIDNLFAQDRPDGGLEIVIISDGSTDRTCELVRQAQQRCPPDRTLVLVDQQPNIGKEAALGVAIAAATGDIVVLSDATTEFQPDVVRKFVDALLADDIGAASGRVVYRPKAGGVAAAFDSYQKFVVGQRMAGRRRQIQVSTSGACSAIWKACLGRYESNLNSDLQLAVLAAEDGLCTAYVADAIAWEESRVDLGEELRGRTRIIRLCLLSLPRLLQRLRACDEGAVAAALLTMKATRWLLWLPIALGMAGLALAALSAPAPVAALAALLAVAAPMAAALAYRHLTHPWPLPARISGLLSGAGYAVLGVIASAWALRQVLAGQTSMGWTPERPTA